MSENIKHKKGLLIVFGGLPGSGKTSIAKELALKLQATYLRIDTIEQTLLRENCLKIGHEGYSVAYALAADNLSAKNIVIADAVNSSSITREAWHHVADKADVNILEIEIICSDKTEHRRRIEERNADITGHKLPTWNDVIDRDYQSWPTKDLTIDTAELNVLNAVKEIVNFMNSEENLIIDLA